ncbi:hypothetical protein Tco_1155511 [Tanacetum coccineum]
MKRFTIYGQGSCQVEESESDNLFHDHIQGEDKNVVDIQMADHLRPMEELLQIPIIGIENAIVVPAVLADEFELKIELLDFITSGNLMSKNTHEALTIIENKAKPSIPYPSRLQKENFQALENLTGRADHFVYRIDILDSLCDKFPIKNNSLSGNPTPSSDFVVESLSPLLIPYEDNDSHVEESNILLSHFDDSQPEYETFSFDIKEKSSGSTTTYSNYSLPDYEAFYFDADHIEEKSSGSTTTQSDFSLPGYDLFIFNLLIDPFPPADRSDSYHEEFIDELTHIISSPEYDCFYFDLEIIPGDFTRVLEENIFDLSTKGLTINELNDSSLLLSDCDSSLSEEFFEIDLLVSFPSGNENKVFDPGILIIDGIFSFTRKFLHLLIYNFLIDKCQILSEISLMTEYLVSFHPKDKEIQGDPCGRCVLSMFKSLRKDSSGESKVNIELLDVGLKLDEIGILVLLKAIMSSRSLLVCGNKSQVSSSVGSSTQIDTITTLTKQVEALISSRQKAYNRNQEASIQLMQTQMGQMEETFQNRPSCVPPSDTKTYPREERKAVTTMSGLTLDGSFIPHSNFLFYQEKEHEPKTITEVVEIARIDIFDSLGDKFPIKNNSLNGNPTPSSDFVVESLSPLTIPYENSDSLVEETNILLSHFDDSQPKYETFSFDIEEKSSGSTTTHYDYSFPDYKAFYFDDDHIEEKSSGSTTTQSDFSLPGYDLFIFDLLIDSFPPADRSDSYHEEFADELTHIISPPEYDRFYFDLEIIPGDFTRVLEENIFDL